jgi:beta-ketoacyl-acyl-carrier-protein synthase II
MPASHVVITGLGLISPVGLKVETAWSNVVNGRSGIGPITLFDTTRFRVKIAGEAWDFDPLNFMSSKEARRADRNVQFALAAADQALRHARLPITPHTADDIGVMIGTGAAGIWTYVAQQKILDTRGPQHLSPLMIPMIVVDSASVQVGIKYGVHGPSLGVAAACATGSDAIGLAYETIKRGDAQAVIAGGTESAVNELGVAGFDNLNALSRRNDAPTEASRPFDRDRDGFVLSEGAGVLILESLDFAMRRGAEPLAEIVAHASTTDGTHLTAPDESAAQAVRAIRRALDKARLVADEVEYINAHATATSIGDRLEVRAVKQVFGERSLPMSSTKSTTGHLLGAAGAVEAIWCVQALRDNVLPPTINYRTPDPDCTIDCVPNVARPVSLLNIVLSAAYGFGGHNSILVLRKIT